MVVFTAARTGAWAYTSQPNLRRFHARGENEILEFLSQFWCNMICFIPLALATGLFAVVFSLVGVFITMYSLTYGGIELYSERHPFTEVGDCNAQMGNWMFVFGWLGLLQMFVTHCLNNSVWEVENARYFLLEMVLNLVQIAWVLHGYFFVLPGLGAECKHAQQYSWFRFIVQFEWFGGLALACSTVVLLALASRVIIAIIHLDSIEQQPLLVVVRDSRV